jgi:BirA family biotin operon repressor/biotin-[acetyl-CoA-carboxylase] ligase
LGDIILVEKEETGSTNDDAKALAEAGAPQGTAVLARRQTRGRGRAGRSFLSPEGGLYLSVVLRPRRPPAEWGLVPLLAGVVVARELRRAGFDASLKWPNDVMISQEKVGGILVESRWGDAPFAVVGVGVNVARVPEVAGATALARHASPPDVRGLAERVATSLVARTLTWDVEGRGPLLAEIRASCQTLGRRVGWEGGEGLAVDVAEDGALVVETGDGSRRRVVAGDVRLALR